MWKGAASFCFLLVVANAANRSITYGSIVQLENRSTGNHLFSIPKVSWSHGGGQIVSGVPKGSQLDDLDSTGWIVRSKASSKGILTTEDLDAFTSAPSPKKKGLTVFNTKDSGLQVSCGDTVRLEHSESGKLLHSHRSHAQLSDSYEVIGFGPESDSNDFFIVECASGSFWLEEKSVKLRHKNLNGFLSTHPAHQYNDRNCPRCPILHHSEISVSKKDPKYDSSIQWNAKLIMRVALTDDDDEDENDDTRDEL